METFARDTRVTQLPEPKTTRVRSFPEELQHSIHANEAKERGQSSAAATSRMARVSVSIILVDGRHIIDNFDIVDGLYIDLKGNLRQVKGDWLEKLEEQTELSGDPSGEFSGEFVSNVIFKFKAWAPLSPCLQEFLAAQIDEKQFVNNEVLWSSINESWSLLQHKATLFCRSGTDPDGHEYNFQSFLASARTSIDNIPVLQVSRRRFQLKTGGISLELFETSLYVKWFRQLHHAANLPKLVLIDELNFFTRMCSIEEGDVMEMCQKSQSLRYLEDDSQALTKVVLGIHHACQSDHASWYHIVEMGGSIKELLAQGGQVIY